LTLVNKSDALGPYRPAWPPFPLDDCQGVAERRRSLLASCCSARCAVAELVTEGNLGSVEVVPTEVRATVAPNLLKRTRSDYHCAMDDTVVRLAGFVAWFSSQPTRSR